MSSVGEEKRLRILSRIGYVTLAGLVVLATVALSAYWRSGDQGGNGKYLTAVIDRGPIAATVTASGTMNPVTTVQVGTYVSGPILALYADFNSSVQKNELVAKIDPAPFAMKVQEAEANVANARAKVEKDRADLELKKLTLSRSRELREKNLISQNDVDTAKSNYDQAVAQVALDQASVQQSRAALESSRINLAYTDIRSPVDGVVVSRNVSVGQTVAASFQTPTLFLIAQDLTKMQVDTNVSESDIGDVREGQPAVFTVDAYPGKEFHGSVAQVRNAPITVQNVVTYDVVIAVDNPKLDLKPGMTATVTITTAQRDQVLRIPARALRFRPPSKTATEAEHAPLRKGPPTVWVVGPSGSVRGVEVKLGIQNDLFAELVSGDLHEGDVVAIALRTEARERSGGGPPRFALGGGGRR